MSENESTRSGISQDTPINDKPTLEPVGSQPEELASNHSLPYIILEKIGTGGMGTVYLARQEIPERLVALKLISGRHVPKEQLVRFHSEHQVLAMMSHSRIAAVYDVGVTKTGDPYFTMEYVPGSETITTFCQKQNLPLRQRLLLFLQICDGVLHAHQRAVVHRDLKPANILVANTEPTATVKIIDFGIAKRLQPQMSPAFETQKGDMLGTPAYMSPEQLAGGQAVVDALSDIYALGLVLYELTTDHHPFDSDRINQLPYDERLRIYREEDPPLPSERAALTKVKHASALRGDLDAVIGKAMAREPNRRYPTVADLARDIGNILDKRPVTARRPSWHYLLTRFIRRNKLMAIVVITMILALLGAGRAAWEQSRKEAARKSAESLNELVAAIQWMPDPGFDDDGMELRILASLEEDLANWPGAGDALKAQTHNTLGEFYMVFGKYDEAVVQFEHALAIEQRSEPAAEQAALYRHNLSRAQRRTGNLPEAVLQAQEALNFYERNPTASQSMKARIAVSLAQALLRFPQRLPEAESLLEEAIEVLTRTKGPSHKDTLLAISSYASVLVGQKKYHEAETTYRLVLKKGSTIYGRGQPLMLAARKNLATSLRRQNRLQEAELLLRETLEIRELVFSMEHASITGSMFSLGVFLFETGKYEEAEARLAEVLKRRRHEKKTRNALITANWLAQALWAQDKRQQAIICLDQELKTSPTHQNEDQRLRTMNNLAMYLLASGNGEKALALSKEAVGFEWPSANLGSSPWFARLNLARAYQMTEHPKQAEEIYDGLLEEVASHAFNNEDLALLIQVYSTLFKAETGDVQAREQLRPYLPQLTGTDHLDARIRVEALLAR